MKGIHVDLPFLHVYCSKIARKWAGLKLKLHQAGILDSPERYIQKAITVSLCYALIANVAFFIIFLKYNTLILTITTFPLTLGMFLAYFWKYPDALISRAKREMEQELVYAGRFLLIELGAGIPLFDAMKNVTKNYPLVGKYFGRIVDRVSLGTSMERALKEAVEETPSQNFRKILWQILNALQTGADIANSLKSVVDNIAEEQLIEVKRYGRKLNPLAMFYMTVAVIIPSLGIAMLIVLSTLVKLQISMGMLVGIALFLGFVQFMFIAMIKSSRPAIEL